MPRSAVGELKLSSSRPMHPAPRDWRDVIIYHLLIDRFHQPPAATIAPPDSSPTDQPQDVSSGATFRGGTLAGITAQLDYLAGLGITALWISPPFKNRQEDNQCYHGYGVQDFLDVDPRFGTLADLQELVRQAHARGISVLLDILLNHSGNNWGYVDDAAPRYQEGQRYDFGFWRRAEPGEGGLGPDDAVWPRELQDPEGYSRRGRIGDMKTASPEEMTDGDFGGYKDFNLDHPPTLDALIRCYQWWIVQTDCDGFRIDTVKHIRPQPLARFCEAIREFARGLGKDSFLLLGEVVGGDETLLKYVESGLRREQALQEFPRLDACLDFPLYFVLEEVLKGTAPARLLRERQESLTRYYASEAEAGTHLVTFVDNHDQMHRPYRRFLHGQADDRLAGLAAGYLLTSPGIPCLYYGTEQGFNGGGSDDWYIRETMFPDVCAGRGRTDRSSFRPAHHLYQFIARVAAIRAAEPALRYGRQQFCDIGNGEEFHLPIAGPTTLAYTRRFDGTTLLVAMNLDSADRSDGIALPADQFAYGAVLRDLLSHRPFAVTRSPHGQPYIRLTLRSYELAILKVDE